MNFSGFRPSAYLRISAYLRHGLLAAAVLSQAGAAPRIVGGTNADVGEYPFIAALLQKGAAPASGQFCAGTLIAPEWVLTAAHCTDGESASALEVWIGGRNRNNPTEGIRVPVQAIYMHPAYLATPRGSLHDDIALLKLSSPVTSINPAPLITSAEEIAPGTNARIIGWGTTSEGGSGSQILLKADVPIVPFASANLYYTDLDASNLAAGYDAGGIDTCQGDSGGPLLIADGLGGWKVGGIVSFGDGCARAGIPGIYTNVATLRTWILSTIERHSVADDHGNSLLTASLFSLVRPPSGIIQYSTDVDFFKITLPTPGVLTLSSTGVTDVKGRLLDSNGTLLAFDDDSAGSPNFRIPSPNLPAGTYYLEVSGHDSTVRGPYGLTATVGPLAPPPVSTDGKQPQLRLKNGSSPLVTGTLLDFGSLTPGNIATKDLTLANTGSSKLRITSATITGPGASDFRFAAKFPTSVAAGRSTTFRINFIPSISATRSASLVLRSSDPLASAITLPLTGVGLAAPADDHGNSRATATLVAKPSSTPGFLSTGDVDYFRIVVTARASLTFSTGGHTDTYGTLYDANGFTLAENDDSGPESNFQIRSTLAPGTYYVAVDGYHHNNSGSYTFIVK